MLQLTVPAAKCLTEGKWHKHRLWKKISAKWILLVSSAQNCVWVRKSFEKGLSEVFPLRPSHPKKAASSVHFRFCLLRRPHCSLQISSRSCQTPALQKSVCYWFFIQLLLLRKRWKWECLLFFNFFFMRCLGKKQLLTELVLLPAVIFMWALRSPLKQHYFPTCNEMMRSHKI